MGRGLGGDEGSRNRRDLHLVDLRIEDPEPAAAGAEHRVALMDLLHASEGAFQLMDLGMVLDAGPLNLSSQLRQSREELVQRGIQQADRYRQSLHRTEDALEVGLLQRQQLTQRIA